MSDQAALPLLCPECNKRLRYVASTICDNCGPAPAVVPLELLARLASNSWYLWDELTRNEARGFVLVPPERIEYLSRIYRDWQDAMAICERAKRDHEKRGT